MVQRGSFKQVEIKLEEDLVNLYKYTSLSFGTVAFEAQILLCVVHYENGDDLSHDWQKLNSFFTANVVSKVDDEFARWNFYMIYVCQQQVAKEIKYKIENNKFASRKIVQDNFTKPFDQEAIDFLISEHITNDNIKLTPQQVEKKAFQKDSRFSSIIVTKKLGKSKNGEEDILTKMLDNIEKKL